jgi:hypothetical protein
MKNLTLSIKEIYFKQILNGEKNTETRDVWPNNVKRYFQHDKEGNVIIADGIIQTVKYDTITFYTGAYVGKRPKMVVRVEKAEAFLLEDDDGEFIIYELDDQEYNAAQIDYTIGEIIEEPTNFNK